MKVLSIFLAFVKKRKNLGKNPMSLPHLYPIPSAAHVLHALGGTGSAIRAVPYLKIDKNLDILVLHESPLISAEHQPCQLNGEDYLNRKYS